MNIAKYLFTSRVSAVIIAEQVDFVSTGGERFGSFLDALLSREFALIDQTDVHQ
jgi:hypothetical protein